MSLNNFKILIYSIILSQTGSIFAEEPVDHSSSNYNETNTLPTSQKFPVDIYCPEVNETMPWSFYGGISFPLYKSPLSKYVDSNAMNTIFGMRKDFGDFNHGYTTIYSLLEAKTYDSKTSVKGVDYRLTRTSFNLGFGIEQGLWTRSFLLFLNLKPGFYQSSFRSSDNLINDYSYQPFLEFDTGFRIYFVRNNEFIFYSNLNLSIDVTRTNSLLLSDGTSINSNQSKLSPGIEFGIGF